jgi:hypothetical protein
MGIGSGLKTHGVNASPLEQHGNVQRLVVDGGCGDAHNGSSST